MARRRSGIRYADMVILAPVYTGGGRRPWAEVVSIVDGRIHSVGSRADVAEEVGRDTRVLHLPDRLVIPGFQDAHVHPPWGGLSRMRCDLREIEPADYPAAIARYAEEHRDAPWILGGGWSMAAFPGGTPLRETLDVIVPDRPVYLTNRDGHGAWVNSRALEMAGISSGTRDPPDGRIERDATGEPAGTLQEGAMDLVERLVPEPTPAEWEKSILLAQSYLHGLGITAWQDAIVTPQTLAAYRRLAERAALTARVVGALWWDRHRGEEQIGELVDLRREGSVGRLACTSVKVMQDGVCENFTASMLEPYLDATGRGTDNRGISMVEPALLNRVVARLDREGFQVHVHAIGDRAVREALDAFEAAVRSNGVGDRRHHIAHLQLVHPADVPRFGAMGVVANAQPFWACMDDYQRELTIPFLGSERSSRQYPFGSLRRQGARLAFGSDWDVSTPDPLLQMEVAVNRTAPDDRGAEPLVPEERIDLAAALEAFTAGSAFVNHLDDLTGSIEPGKLADLAILDRDIFAPDAGPIGEARVVLTLVEGEPVHAEPGIW